MKGCANSFPGHIGTADVSFGKNNARPKKHMTCQRFRISGVNFRRKEAECAA